jgi:hypothetical protein
MRVTTFAAFLALVAIIAVAPAQTISRTPLSPRNANYAIDVTLDVEKKTLEGREVLEWKNISNDRITELQFHLYLNAFKNSESTFMKESGGQNRGIAASSTDWGWTNVTRMQLADGTDLLAGATFIQPDDGNIHDQTVLRVPLPKPVRPGETIKVEIDFRARLPKIFARTGFVDNYFFVGQWFPKIGVWEPAGMRGRTTAGWNSHQFHSNTEFYADYGVYDVQMTVPKGYVLGATGVLQSLREHPNGAITHAYRAEDVHDFAWTCSREYMVFEETWKHVTIKLMIQPEHVETAKDRYFASTKAALEYFDQWLGTYPYTNVTVVDPPIYATGAGGMEYPTLITGGSARYIPSGLRMTELVTVHEFGHQYWYGLVGNNEFEEAWLDEGFNQYSETRIMDATYGEKTGMVDVAGFRIGDAEFARDSYVNMRDPKAAPIDIPAWEFPDGAYGSVTYSKTATWLITLERLIGRPVMDEVMRTYYERWRFRHPGRADFEAVVNEVVRNHHGARFGPSMDWFFVQMLDGTELCDYAVGKVGSRRVAAPRGEGVDTTGSSARPRLFETTVTVERRGEVMLPVDVLVTFTDGYAELVTWDGKARVKKLTFIREHEVVAATVDPEHRLWIDKDFGNNAYSTEVSTAAIWKYTFKMLYWLQNAVQYAAIL